MVRKSVDEICAFLRLRTANPTDVVVVVVVLVVAVVVAVAVAVIAIDRKLARL
jgi:hypothetical protein